MKLQNALKNLDQDTVKEIESLNIEELKQKIVLANQSIQQATDDLENNEQYQELKESIKVVSSGLRDLKKRQNSIITVALHVLESKGQ